MERNDCFELGYISKTRGLKGEVTAKLDTDQPNSYRKLGSVFVAYEQQELIPFSISFVRIDPKGTATIKFETVNTLDEAKEMVGSTLLLPLDFLPKLTGKKFYFHEVIGMEVIDATHGALGKIVKVLEHTAQPVIQVNKGHGEILIPAMDDFIVEIDREQRTFRVDVPEGLVELYRGD